VLQERPGGFQRRPSGPQEHPTSGQEGFKISQERLKSGQEGSKSTPTAAKRLQDQPRVPPERPRVILLIFCWFYKGLAAHLARPRRSQEQPKSGQDDPKISQERSKSGQDGPKSTPRAANMVPRSAKSSQERPRAILLIFHWFYKGLAAQVSRHHRQELSEPEPWRGVGGRHKSLPPRDQRRISGFACCLAPDLHALRLRASAD
jgi:hypothetical protein